jgi:hypothetical protein
MKDMFEKGVYFICNQHFGMSSDGINITPRLNRTNNKIGHSLSNCKPCCERCKCLESESVILISLN